MFTLQILHASDLEGGVDAVKAAPNFAAIVDRFEQDAETGGFGSILLSAGDNTIPSPFYNAAAQDALAPVLQQAYQFIYGDATLTAIEAGAGRVDYALMNLMGFDASALGNHEFDNGTAALAGLLGAEVEDGALLNPGTLFPYLSANLDFYGEASLAALFTAEVLTADAYAPSLASLLDGTAQTAKVAASTVIEEQGERIGVIGATTQLLDNISSNGNVADKTGVGNDMVELAAVLQVEIDRVIAGADGTAGTADDVNKVVLVTHLQDINLEKQLATLLTGVDVIIAGGSDTLQADGTDRLRDGDTAAEGYPFVATDADGNPVAIVSTDGEYSYVGRLVVTFDENGIIVPDSIDEGVSGAYATDDQGVLDVTGAADIGTAIAGSDSARLAGALTDAVQLVLDEAAANGFGQTSVYLDGRREQVRTQETNLGSLTSQANISAAQAVDPTVAVSLKNGGGIRDDIGDLIRDSEGNVSFEAPFGGVVTQLDVQNSLRFDNGLTLVTLDAAGLKAIVEHAVAGVAPGSTPGSFAQVAGFRFSYDASGTAQVTTDGVVTTPGTRVQSIALVDEDGNTTQLMVQNGEVVAGAPSVRMVTLGFLAEGGDGYPFPSVATDIVETGIGEQQAFQDYMSATFPVGGDAAFDQAETDQGLDTLIQNLAQRSDTVVAPIATETLRVSIAQTFEGGGEGGSEVVAHESGRLYTTNGLNDRIDVFDIAGGGTVGTIDLSMVAGYNGVQSVAVKNGVGVAVVDIVPGEGGAPVNGVAVIFDAATLDVITTVATGNLPDAVAASPDGTLFVIANEGEFNEESDVTSDAPGGITIVDVSDLGAVTAQTVTFAGSESLIATAIAGGLRIAPGVDPLLDLEPEYVTFSPDGATVFVTLQENNGVAVFDVATRAFTAILPLGTVDHSVSGLDATDNETIDIATYDTLVGIRMPDAIASFEADGQTFFVTANEGDGRGYDESRIRSADIDAGVDTTDLGRLVISTIDGDTDMDGDIDVLHAFGGRSFTIFAADGTVMFDSGEDFERIVANRAPERFLDDDGELGQNRADAKGVEPEAIEVGRIGDRTYAFIGLERDSGIMIYDITDPANAAFVEYIDGFGTGNLAPEVIEFIPAEVSGTGTAQIAVSYEVSGTTVVYDLEALTKGGATPDLFIFDGLSDRVEGGAGIDTMVFQSSIAGATFEAIEGGFRVDLGAETVDLIGVEQFVFSDAIVRASTDATAAQVARLYEAALGRSADIAGQTFWTDAVDTLTLAGVAEAFFISGEFTDLYGTEPSGETYVSALYQNVLDREADAEGLAFWTAQLDGSVLDEGNLLLAFSESVEFALATQNATDDGVLLFV